MKKSVIITIVSVVSVASVIVFACLFARTITVKSNSDFKKVYNSEDDIANIQIDIMTNYDEPIDEQVLLATITSEDDISYIIDTLKDEKLGQVSLGDELLGGGGYRFTIRNNKNGSEVSIIIHSTQVRINDKNYTNDSLFEKLTDVYQKYTQVVEVTE